MNPPDPAPDDDVPVWARPDAFPIAPSGWGWVDLKGNQHPCPTLSALATAIREDPDGSVNLVWTPEASHMILPEELGGMSEALRTARERWTRNDLTDAAYRLRWFGMILGGLTLYTFFGGWVLSGRHSVSSGGGLGAPDRLIFAARATLGSIHAGLALLMFVIFAFIPWYQARKRRGELGKWTEEGIAEFSPTIRFETWLAGQKAPLTKMFLGLVALVALAQIFSQVGTRGIGSLGSLFHNWDYAAAGLVKPKYASGEWWRLFTAPLLHGNILHLLMNAAALAYLGKRLEVFARWPHLPLVFLFAASIGGVASARLVDVPTVGASGGLMGWLGFLMVFETLHKKLVPRRARRRLAAGVLVTALIGLVGYRYIDNAAHAGGLLAGIVYGLIVFPPTASSRRPRSTMTDRLAGIGSMAVIVAAAIFAIVRIFAGNGG